MQHAHDLPEDIESLRALLIEARAALEAMHTTLHSRELEIEHLRGQLARLRRMQFGRSSEALDTRIAQLELTLEELEAAEAAAPPAAPLPAVSARRKPVRQALPAHLPRETITHLPPSVAAGCTCPECGAVMRALGEDVSEILEYLPARFKVIRHVRPKLSCAKCQKIVQAPAPSRPIERGLAGPALLAHVLVSKYADHLPLYRQSQIYAREGVELDRSTLAEWVGGASTLLAPLLAALERYVLSAEKLHGDDTPVPVLAPGTGKTKTGRLWTYVRDDRPSASAEPPALFCRYSPDRKGERPCKHLAKFRGILQADAYSGFNGLYDRKQDPLIEAACWAHVRRKFYDIHAATHSPAAREALERIGTLYGIEAQIRGQPPDERAAIRQARAGPLLEDFHAWLLATLRKLSKKSDLAGAIGYALSRWQALCRFRDDGRIELDNNAAERALRAVALGRKNYLFAGSDSGGERAAAMYSLIGTAKLNGLDPQRYLHTVLERIAEHPINRIEELLPWNIPVAPVQRRAA